MAEFPALPLWTDAYLADTLDLSAEQHGCYFILLMLTWRQPDCAITSDLKILRRLLGGCVADMHGNRFNRVVPALLERFFTLGQDGKYRQKRLGKERDFQRTLSGKQKEKALKRWGNEATNEQNQRVENATAMQQQSHGNASSPSPSPVKEIVSTPNQQRPVGDAALTTMDRVFEIMGVTKDPRWMGDGGMIRAWIGGGADPEMDIFPTVTALMAKRNGSGPPGSLKYFSQAISDALARRLGGLPPAHANGGNGAAGQASPDYEALQRQAEEKLDARARSRSKT